MSPIWLARLILNRRSRDARHDLGDSAMMHARMAGMVDGLLAKPGPGEPRLLYRADSHVVLVQSPVLPDWSRLPAGYLTDADEDDLSFHAAPPVKRIEAAVASLTRGSNVSFRLKTWPNQMCEQHRTRQTITDPASIMAWLHHLGDRHGFEVPDARFRVEGWPRAWAGKPMALPSRVTLYEGQLRVRDPEALRRAVRCGVGRGRAFGLGLLTLARLQL